MTPAANDDRPPVPDLARWTTWAKFVACVAVGAAFGAVVAPLGPELDSLRFRATIPAIAIAIVVAFAAALAFVAI